MAGTTINLIGQRFGRLQVTGIAGVDSRRNRLYRCQCDCGGTVDVATAILRLGRKQSCGCMERENKDSKRTDIKIGDRFGRIVVTGISKRTQNGGVAFRVRCDCGNEKACSPTRIRAMKYPSCGCWGSEQGGKKIRRDLTGTRYGKLTALRLENPESPRRWVCRCDCGNQKTVPTTSLISGRTVSCGCAKKDPVIYTPKTELARSAVAGAKRRARKVNAGGSHKKADIDALYLKQMGRCAGCGSKLTSAYHRDHIIPLCAGGDNSISNIQLLCALCNLKKGKSDPIDWAQAIGRLL